MLAHRESDVPLSARPDTPPSRGPKPKHIVVAWWDREITDLAKSVSIFAPPGSTITVVSAEAPEVPTTTACVCFMSCVPAGDTRRGPNWPRACPSLRRLAARRQR